MALEVVTMPIDTCQRKKIILLYILEILRERTDINHKLSITEIGKILDNTYNIKVDRKAIKSNLNDLISMFDNIEYSEKKRITPERINGKNTGKMMEEMIQYDFYYIHEFDESELRLILDSLLFSKYIPYNQCKDLMDRICRLGSTYFKGRMKHVHNLPQDQPTNTQLFWNIEVLDEAIEQEKKVSFTYNNYDTDKKLHPRKDANTGLNKKYTVTPYQMVATNGRYYLICKNDVYDNVSHMRIDRITDIELLDEHGTPKSKVTDFHNGRLDLPKHMAEHIYMFSGKSDFVTFKAKRYLCNDILDWFGSNVRFSEVTDEDVTVIVKSNLMAMKFWALQFADHITVISPESLRNEVKESLDNATRRYDNNK